MLSVGLMVQSSGFRFMFYGSWAMDDLWVMVYGSWFIVHGSAWCIDQGPGSSVECRGFKVLGSGIRVQGPGFRVQGLGGHSAFSAYCSSPGAAPSVAGFAISQYGSLHARAPRRLIGGNDSYQKLNRSIFVRTVSKSGRGL